MAELGCRAVLCERTPANPSIRRDIFCYTYRQKVTSTPLAAQSFSRHYLLQNLVVATLCGMAHRSPQALVHEITGVKAVSLHHESAQ